ncbi:MAG: gluconate 2-dehydrogenase subunit 3 family protein [Crocinitomicaceae bacterium]|nr:gluconate 2-dehydrogenase subunit 3 family protein [Crocinitomicaceae bacterium]
MSESKNSSNDLIFWQTNRRKILKAAIIAGALSQFSFLEACASGIIDEENNLHFTAEQNKILKNVMEILFPDDGNGPGINALNSFKYMLWVMDDEGAYQKNKDKVKTGVEWLEKYTSENYQKKFTELEKQDQEKTIAEIIQEETGEDFCSVLLTYILESLLLDPVYGINPEETGWKWLSHTPGYPQANEELRYENILTIVRASYSVNS